METEKKKRGRPLKKRLTETMGLTAEGAVNYALDREVKSELDKALADKPNNQLTDEERKYLEMQRENKTRTLNIRFTESEYQGIVEKCKEYGYKKKSEYVRDCVRARVPSVVQQADLSETNRLMKAIGNNINQIAVRLHSTGNFYAEDMTEIKRGVSQIWQLLISIQSKQISAEQSATSLTQIRPSTDYMSRLIYAEMTAEEQPKISPKQDSEERDEQKSFYFFPPGRCTAGELKTLYLSDTGAEIISRTIWISGSVSRHYLSSADFLSDGIVQYFV